MSKLLTATRVEKHVIKSSCSYFSMLMDFCHKSKNLYNHANYIIRNKFTKENILFSYGELDKILKKDGNLEFKTDNRDLFDFAVEEVEPAGWKVDEITYDLHNDEIMVQGNIMTEYEERFSSKGNPIYKYIISR